MLAAISTSMLAIRNSASTEGGNQDHDLGLSRPLPCSLYFDLTLSLRSPDVGARRGNPPLVPSLSLIRFVGRRTAMENASRYGSRASAARIARIVAEAYRGVVASGEEEGVRWPVMGYDDTVFFPENLAAVLGKYDHEQMWYVGGVSESVEQDVMHSYGMAFGGGGFAVSLPAAVELARVLDRWLERSATGATSGSRPA